MSKWLAIAVMLCGLSLSGCAHLYSARYSETLDSWRGQNVDSLIGSWGAPDSVFNSPSGSTLLTYFQDNGSVGTVHQIGYTQFVRTHQRTCKTTFTVSDATIVGWNFEGYCY